VFPHAANIEEKALPANKSGARIAKAPAGLESSLAEAPFQDAAEARAARQKRRPRLT